jgi:hypothetical protein
MDKKELHELVSTKDNTTIVKREGVSYLILGPDWTGFAAKNLNTGKMVSLDYHSTEYEVVHE